MSPSWNFPARAEPSYKVSEPSRAELEHFNFRAESELSIFFMYSFFSSIFYFSCFYQFLNQKINHFNDINQYSLQKTSENRVIKVQNAREIRKKNLSGKKCQLSDFRAEFFFRADGEKATSRAEPSWKSFSSSYGASQLGSDSSLEDTNHSITKV